MLLVSPRKVHNRQGINLVSAYFWWPLSTL
jgi:hypothetical protein